jgi:hypothetical protein
VIPSGRELELRLVPAQQLRRGLRRLASRCGCRAGGLFEKLAVQSLVRRRVDGLILTTARINTPIPLWAC